ncbi:MAG: sugar lactone lactonase YvrE [Pseudorhodobacter sp.]|jgi:sugar lactone lactonase YvrE
MTAVFDPRVCELGEGPLWHPIREQLFWFDILSCKLYSRLEGEALEWQFPEMVSAAGWVSRSELLIASETALFRFNLETGSRQDICALEADNPKTRSNDGRADPQGGFWIGTMGKSAQPKAGSIYRLYRGETRKLFNEITIPNTICFAPEGDRAYFSDTAVRKVMRVNLDHNGWPNAEPVVFLDLSAQGYNPDGAVVDLSGNIWLAQWGASRVACYDKHGTFLQAITIGATQSSCPAFGGPQMKTLFCTTAAHNMSAQQIVQNPVTGKLFKMQTEQRGQYEHQVILP